MNNYQLASNEAVLYKGTILNYSEKEKHNSIGSIIVYELILTNLNMIFVTKVKKLLSKEESSYNVIPIDTIKVYDDKPQVKQKGVDFVVYFTDQEYSFSMPNKFEAVKFNNKIMELVTGKSMSIRNSEKFKSAVNIVDDTLGIDSMGTVASVLQNGVKGTIFNGIAKKTATAKPSTKKIINSVLDVIGNDNSDNNNVKSIESNTNENIKLINDEQIETIKKLKDLLDLGVLSQEEFDAKKKELLGL